MDRRFEVRRRSACGAGRSAVFVACLAVSMTLGAAALFAASAPSFARPKNYATGPYPYSVGMGDLNGDGNTDLATANFDVGANTISVLLNRGGGSFQAKHDYRTGRGPVSVAIGDLNGDGKPDLATANNGEGVNTVSVLLNQRDGSFQPKVDYRTGPSPQSVAIGDVNGDGKPDLATANWTDEVNTVSVLWNRGDGSFEPKRDYRTDGGPDSVAIGDLSGDGKPDLATANFGSSVSVLLNQGDGSFGANVDYRTGRGAESIAIGDLNGDGKPDLATANEAETVSVLLNRGNGRFKAKRDYRAGEDEANSVVIGDVDGDRKPDLVTSSLGTVSVLLNTGGGGFRPRFDYPVAGGARSVAIGDLDHRGKLDLATANVVPNTVSVLLASTAGACTVPNVRRRSLPAARRSISRAHCRLGNIRRVYSKIVMNGRVISEYPKPPTVLPAGGRVDLLVSRGRRR